MEVELSIEKGNGNNTADENNVEKEDEQNKEEKENGDIVMNDVNKYENNVEKEDEQNKEEKENGDIVMNDVNKYENKDRQDEENMKIYNMMDEEGGFYSMKEIECIGNKYIIETTMIREMINHMVEEGMILSKRVGSVVLYWVPRVNKLGNMMDKKENLEKEKIELKGRLSELGEKVIMLEEEMGGIDVENVIKEYDSMKKRVDEMNIIINNKKVDVDVLNKQISVAKSAIVRWVDNISVIQHWLEKKHLMGPYC